MGQSEALRGCIPILVTPFADDGSLDLESLEREIDWVLAEGASGVACVAIASEGYKLTETERDAVIATTVRRIDGRAPVVASADGPGEEPAIDRARRAAALGADALMVLPSYFVKPGPDGLVSYYVRIAEAAGIPIMLQDAPQLTGVSMSPALWARIAESTPRLRYVKAEGTPQGPDDLRDVAAVWRSRRRLLRLGRVEPPRRPRARCDREYAGSELHSVLRRRAALLGGR